MINILVIEDVYHSPPKNKKFSSKGLEGYVKDIWEKCEIGIHRYHDYAHHNYQYIIIRSPLLLRRIRIRGTYRSIV